MYFRKNSEERRLWDESRAMINSVKNERRYKEQVKQYAQEIRQTKWNKWTERVLRWFIIISIIMIYNLFIGAIAIYIYH